MLLRIATRASKLAIAQANLAAKAITRQNPSAEIEIIKFTTRGDKTAGPLWQAGGKGLFTGELEKALATGQADIAVHSAKDMPAKADPALPIAAILQREDPRDALISCDGEAGKIIGTSSLRRSAFAKKYYPGISCQPLRGNVETRISKVAAGEYDSAILAMAGLKRLDLVENTPAKITPLDIEKFIPAAGQGCIAIQCNADNKAIIELLQKINHAESSLALFAEREVVAHFGVSCHSCFAVHFRKLNHAWQGLAMTGKPDGSEMIFAQGLAENINHAKVQIIDMLEEKNARELLKN